MLREKFEFTIPQLAEKAFLSVPDKEAIFDGYSRLTYRELQAEVNQVASGLNKLGVVKGDRVAVCLPNWNEFVVIFLAIEKLGAILVPLNTRYRADEVEYVLENSGAKVAFFTDEFDKVKHSEQFLQAHKVVKSLQHLITVRFEMEGYMSYDQLRKYGHDSEIPEVELIPEEDIAAFVYTSGTTGKSKGVMLTHRNIVSNGILCAEALRSSSNDVYHLMTPFFHIMGISHIIQILACETKGVLMDVYKPDRSLRLIEEEKISIHSGVPTMFILELNHPLSKTVDLSSLRTGIVAAAPCPIEIVRRIRSEMGCEVLTSYGMTEASPALTFASFEDDDVARSETVGKALPGIELKIVDDNRQEVKVGEVGELACRSIGLMKGYYQMPEKTREVLDEEGWYYSGDLATIDEQGYVRIVGRKKDMIIRGGFNIYPREIEEIFYTHPSVMEIAIVGLPDSVLGEISCAVITLKPDKPVEVEELRTFISERVADFKVPDHIIFMENIPKTASGKITKEALKQKIIDENRVKLR
jgi:acyl-CoA synthetase (AMP-forming)/AMP-acid ligase II